MIRLPNRPDRLGDDGPLGRATRPGGEEIPDPAAEVRAGQEHIAVQRDQDQPGQHVGEGEESRHPATSARTLTGMAVSAVVGLLRTCW